MAFLEGFAAFFATVLLPLVGILLEAHPKLSELPGLIGIVALLSLAAGLIGGLCFVVPKLLYAWAYKRVTKD